VKGTSIAKLLGVIVAVAILGFFTYKPIVSHINLGLDLQGGLHVVMEAKEKPGQAITTDTIKKTIAVLRNRVDGLGVKEPIVQAQGTKRVIVELAGIKDPEAAARILPQTAQLSFVDESGKVIVTGANLKDAKANIAETGQPEVNLEFDKEGAKMFAEGTAANVGKTISINLDKEVISAPRVDEAISGGQARISGGFADQKEAEKLAVLLRSGAIPVELHTVEKRTVGPSLGSDSLNKSLHAGIIGLIMILIFMIGFYYVPGIVAAISLALYSIIVLGIMALLGTTLTLPGIAAFLLSIGMAVDANVLIFERLKEELRWGRSLEYAVDSAFTRAWPSIRDSNLSTVISSIVLIMFGRTFGAQPVMGFAVNLVLGVIVSMFTAVVVTRTLMSLVFRGSNIEAIRENRLLLDY
jgi:preprotein translocase subunit SecD